MKTRKADASPHLFKICLIIALSFCIIVINLDVKLIERKTDDIRIEVSDMPKRLKKNVYVLKLPKVTQYSRFRKSRKKRRTESKLKIPKFEEITKLGIRSILPVPDLMKTYETILVDKAQTEMVPPSIIGGLGALRKRIRYPEWLIPYGIVDTVIVKAHVTWEGKIDEIVIIRQPKYRVFVKRVISALKRTRFNPALQGGVPALRGCWLLIPFTFKAKELTL